MLQNNASAAFLNSQLSGTEWRVSDISQFLSKAAKDPRQPGSPYTWRDVFNETDHAIQTISRFMEVGGWSPAFIFCLFNVHASKRRAVAKLNSTTSLRDQIELTAL